MCEMRPYLDIEIEVKSTAKCIKINCILSERITFEFNFNFEEK